MVHQEQGSGKTLTNFGTECVILSLVHDVLNAGQFIWLPLQHLVQISKVIDEPNSAILFRYNE